MKNKKAGIVSLCTLLVMIAVIIFYFLKDMKILPDGDNLWNKNSTISSEKDTSTSMEASNSYIAEETLSQSKIDTNRQSAEVCDLKFTVLSANISKNSEGLPTPNSVPSEITFDENGTITSKHSYIKLNLKIENLKDSEELLSLNNNKLEIYSKNEQIDGSSIYTMNANEGNEKERDFFHFSIRSKTENSFVFAFIAEDKNLLKSNDIIFKIDPWGQSGAAVGFVDGEKTPVGDDNVAYIRLNDFFEEGSLQ